MKTKHRATRTHKKIGDGPRCSGRANIYCLKQVIFRIPILFGIDTDIGEKFELLEIHDSTSTNIPFLNSDLSKKTREPCVILHSLIQLFFISIRWRGILLFCICKNSSSWCNGYRVRQFVLRVVVFIATCNNISVVSSSPSNGLGLGCLSPLSTIFQLFRHPRLMGQGQGVYRHFQQYFSCFVAVSSIGRGIWRTYISLERDSNSQFQW